MDQNPSLEFEFFLATKLGMTVDSLRESMSAEEFVAWTVYFGREAQQRELAAGERAGK